MRAIRLWTFYFKSFNIQRHILERNLYLFVHMDWHNMDPITVSCFSYLNMFNVKKNMWSYECMTLWTAAYHDNWHQLCDDVLSLSIGLGCQPKMKANYSIPFFGLCPIIVNALDIGLAQRVKEQWLGQRCWPDCHDRIWLAFMTFAVVIGYSLLMLTIFFLNGFNKWHQLDDLITNRTLFFTQLVYPKSSRVLCAIIKVKLITLEYWTFMRSSLNWQFSWLNLFNVSLWGM